MKPSKVRRRLQQSLTDGRIATAVRDEFELTMTDGFVIALTNDWVVMHALDAAVYLDEIVMLRLQDISRVWFRDDDAYHHRAVTALGERVASYVVHVEGLVAQCEWPTDAERFAVEDLKVSGDDACQC